MKRLLYIALLLLATNLSAAPHLSRSYVYRDFTTRDGLPQMQITHIFQDRDGFMWFGTKGGLSRFDGEHFKNFTPDMGFPSWDVFNIDQWGDKIVTNVGGHNICIIYPDDHFDIYKIPSPYFLNLGQILPLNNHQMFAFSGNISVDKKECDFLLDLKTKDIKKVIGFDEKVFYIHNDTIVTPTGFFKYKNFHFQRILSYPVHLELNLIIDWKSKNIYGFNDRELSRLLVYKFTSKGEISLSYKISDIKQDHSYLIEKHLFNAFQPIKSYSDSTKHYGNPPITGIHCTFTDKENNLWLGGDNGIYNFFNTNIEEYRFGLSEPDNIWSVLEDNNHIIWLGSFGQGLWWFYPNGKIISSPKYKDWRTQYIGGSQSPNGNVYMPYGNGIAVFKDYRLTEITTTGPCLYSFFDSITNNIYYAGVGGKNHTWGLYKGIDNDKRFWEWNKGLITILRDSKGRIRLGGSRGQAMLIGDSLIDDTTKHDYPGLSSMDIDSLGRIWKGTEKGIYVELPNGKEYRVGGQRITGQIGSIKVWKNKYVVAGAKSIYIIDIKEISSFKDIQCVDIGYDAGFTGLEAGQNGMCIDHNNDVWLTTATCVLKFNPEKLFKSQRLFIPPIRVAKLFYSKDNVNWEQQIFSLDSELIKSPSGGFRGLLPSSNKFLRFEYIANSISAPKSLRFKYRLKGFSDEWSLETYEKTVEFTNLGFGKYQFEVQCSLDGIHWSAMASSPEIRILAPFLLRWYMWVLYSLLFVTVIVGITLYVFKRKEKKKTELLSRQKLENELQLRTLHSKVLPHFTKNVLTAIGHFAMDDNRKAGKYIAMFSKFTQLTLANSDKNYNTLENELNYIQTYLDLEQMRFGDRFSFKITLDKNINLNLYVPAMALHTYCDNAIRHGLVNKKDTGKLNVIVTKKPQGTLITVSDNGIGRKRSAELGTQGNGMGLKLVQQQIDFYNKMNEAKISQNIIDLQDDKGNSLGTQIELFIPDGYKFSGEK